MTAQQQIKLKQITMKITNEQAFAYQDDAILERKKRNAKSFDFL